MISTISTNGLNTQFNYLQDKNLHNENLSDLNNSSSVKDNSSLNYEVPLSVFCSDLGMLESMVKHLRHAHGLKNSEIASLIGRSEKCASSAYSRAKRKSSDIVSNVPSSINNSSNSYYNISIPVSIVINRKLGALEAVSLYLHEIHNLKYSEIASILSRDQRTIWTAVSRARKKQLEQTAAFSTEPSQAESLVQ